MPQKVLVCCFVCSTDQLSNTESFSSLGLIISDSTSALTYSEDVMSTKAVTNVVPYVSRVPSTRLGMFKVRGSSIWIVLWVIGRQSVSQSWRNITNVSASCFCRFCGKTIFPPLLKSLPIKVNVWKYKRCPELRTSTARFVLNHCVAFLAQKKIFKCLWVHKPRQRWTECISLPGMKLSRGGEEAPVRWRPCGDWTRWTQQSLDGQRRRRCPAPPSIKSRSVSGSLADCRRHTGTSNDRQQLPERSLNHCQSSLLCLNWSSAHTWAQC